MVNRGARVFACTILALYLTWYVLELKDFLSTFIAVAIGSIGGNIIYIYENSSGVTDAILRVIDPIFRRIKPNSSIISADDHYENAKKLFEKNNYMLTILTINKALKLMEKEETSPLNLDFYNGAIMFLRGRALEAAGIYLDSLKDYQTAINQGNSFLSTKGNPFIKRNFKRNSLAEYHAARGKIFAKLKRYDLADKDISMASILRKD